MIRAFLCLCFFLLLPFAARAQAIEQPDGAGAPVMQTGPVPLPGPLGAITIPTEQQKSNVLQRTLDFLAKLPQKTQDRLLDEAAQSKQYCQQNPMLRNFYDCSCYSLRMLDSRLRLGPNVPMANMIRGTDLDICADQTAAAGYSYTRCQDMLKPDLLSDHDVNAMCECAARSMTQSWARQPAASIATVNGLFLQSMMSCQTTLQPAGLLPPDVQPENPRDAPPL